MRQNTFRFRSLILAVLLLAFLVWFLVLLYNDQIVNGINIDESSAANTITTEETVEAARGIITDRNGQVLVGNETIYNVALDVGAMGDYSAQADVVRRLLELCQELGLEVNDGGLPLTWDGESWQFTSKTPFVTEDEDGNTSDTRFAQLCQEMGWPTDASAPEKTARAMLSTFGLEDENDLDVLDVLYACYLREKEILWITWYLAEDVDIAFIATVKEEDLSGVEIKSTTQRVYQTTYAAHLLGQVGLISAEDWDEGENYQAQGYSMDATVGISGVEYAFESYLRGTSGTVQRVTSLDGNLLSESYVEEPEAGNTVTLTLDIGLQEAVEQALEQYTEEINEGEGGSAAVVIDISDGSVLAAASWPTYDISQYRTLYSELASDEGNPLFNRAFLGTYAPGSTYKMVTATAGLNTGVITADSTINCTGYMDYYGTTFRCWYYRQYGLTHGLETVTEALRDSCNIFFYTVGSQVGIETLTEYAQSYGLGVSTGIELAESTGVNAGPEYSDQMGTVWYPGNTLSAAIGQSDNQFTPLQLCNYIATLVNGGNRYSVHLLKSVTTAKDGEVVAEYEPEVVNTVELADDDRAAILEGMAEVVESTATVQEAFASLTEQGIQVGAKTGSAQVSGQENANGLFVCFAPYDDPEIAVCVAVEKGGSGAATSVIAAAIMEYYFAH
ncbi:MAG: penicillin-binding protein [Clostridiales bacterium]|nr:penicillin-binding protein [Clostridiales bacterium]